MTIYDEGYLVYGYELSDYIETIDISVETIKQLIPYEYVEDLPDPYDIDGYALFEENSPWFIYIHNIERYELYKIYLIHKRPISGYVNPEEFIKMNNEVSQLQEEMESIYQRVKGILGYTVYSSSPLWRILT